MNLNEFIDSIRLGKEQHSNNMTIIPFRSYMSRDADVLTFEEGLCNGLEITEVDGGGNVPNLRAINNGNQPVILPEGSVVEGNRQNRIIRQTIMLNPQQEINVDVFCGERGRWGKPTKSKPSKQRAYAGLRKSMMLDPNQSSTWNNIQRKQRMMMKARSKTENVSDIYDENRASLADYMKAFRIRANHNGFVVMIDGKVVGLEYYGLKKGILRKQSTSILQGYAVEAISHDLPKAEFNTVNEFLKAIGDAGQEQVSENHIALKSESLTGRAYAPDGNVMHMACFAV